MRAVIERTGRIPIALATPGDLPARLSGKLRAKLVHFGQTIAAFPQRRWA